MKVKSFKAALIARHRAERFRRKLPSVRHLYQPVIAFAGMLGQGAEANWAYETDSFSRILKVSCILSDAIDIELLMHVTKRAMRMIPVGQKLFLTEDPQKRGLLSAVCYFQIALSCNSSSFQKNVGQ